MTALQDPSPDTAASPSETALGDAAGGPSAEPSQESPIAKKMAARTPAWLRHAILHALRDAPSPAYQSKKTAWWHLRPIFWITLLGALLRITMLTQPALWNDETLTYMRVIGSYQNLLDILQYDGFAPLHYELYWCISRVFFLSPMVMRMVPLLSGVFMVPAMYFLARQIVSRSVANLVALFTACSAYMLVYSRDAKMYPHFYLFCVLTIACYLWWLRSNRRMAWLAWIACGLAMVGLHTPGVVLVGLLPVLLLTSAQIHWKKGLLTAIGMAVIVSGPVGYYLKFNKFIDRSETEDFNQATGTTWVKSYNAGRDGPDLALYASTAYLFSWEWPSKTQLIAIDPDVVTWLERAAMVLLLIIPLGALPWPRRWRAGEGDPPPPQKWWRVGLWLSVWLIVPAYAFYAQSIQHFAVPMDWVHWFGDIFNRRWVGVSLCAACAGLLIPLLRKHGGWILVGAGLLAAVVLTAFFILPSTIDAWSCFVTCTLVVGSATCFYASGHSTARRLANVLLLGVIVTAVLALCWAVASATDPASDNFIWMPRYVGVVFPAFVIAMCALISRLPSRALRWGVIGLLLCVNIQRFTARVMCNINADDAGHLLITGAEPPLDRMAMDIVNSDTMRHEPIGNNTINWRPKSTTRVYAVPGDRGIPHPGHGTITESQGRYYLAETGQDVLTPQEFRSMNNGRRGALYDIDTDPSDAHIIADLKARPQADRIIVWDHMPARVTFGADTLEKSLEKTWMLVNVQTFEVFQHWTWENLGTYRRREYVKKP